MLLFDAAGLQIRPSGYLWSVSMGVAGPDLRIPVISSVSASGCVSIVAPFPEMGDRTGSACMAYCVVSFSPVAL